MKKRFIVVGTALLAAIILSLLGALILPDPYKFQSINNPTEIYELAVSNIATSVDLALNVSTTRETSLTNQLYLEQTQQKLTYYDLGTDSMSASLTETLSIDNHTVEVSEIFSAGMIYSTVDGSTFKSEASAQEYQARYSPAVLLDASLYSFITGGQNRDGYVIFFHNATAAESWTGISTDEFIDAQGIVYIDPDGNITHNSYTVTYTRANAQIKQTVSVDISVPTELIDIPSETDSYIAIDDPDTLRILERVSGYLLQSESIIAYYSDKAYFQAFGDERTQDITLSASQTDKWAATLKTSISLTNTGREGEISHLDKTETFKDNIYSVSVNGGEETRNKDITEDNMRGYCRDILLGTVMLPQHVTSAQINDQGDTIVVTYTGSDTFAQQISSSTCQSLYQTPDLLEQQAESYVTDTLQCYVKIDKTLGLPLASGINYSGTYTLEGLPYTLRFQADQSYIISTIETTTNGNEPAG